MSGDASNAAKMILLGLACVAGAAVLAWLSSVATMRLVRTGGEGATVTIDSRLAGLIDVGHERVDGVKSAALIRSRTPGSDSDTPDHMVFETAAGPVNLGRPQQLFARDFSDIKAFLDDPTQPEATFSSIGRGSEFRRFIVAQVIAAFLAVLGLCVTWAGLKSLRA